MMRTVFLNARSTTCWLEMYGAVCVRASGSSELVFFRIGVAMVVCSRFAPLCLRGISPLGGGGLPLLSPCRPWMFLPCVCSAVAAVVGFSQAVVQSAFCPVVFGGRWSNGPVSRSKTQQSFRNTPFGSQYKQGSEISEYKQGFSLRCSEVIHSLPFFFAS